MALVPADGKWRDAIWWCGFACDWRDAEEPACVVPIPGGVDVGPCACEAAPTVLAMNTVVLDVGLRAWPYCDAHRPMLAEEVK